MSLTYSEPEYIQAGAAAAALADETRPAARLAPQALIALNHLIDEVLHLVVHSALHSTPSPANPTGSPTGGLSDQPPTPLGPEERLTTDRFKSALARILGPTPLVKECIVEAELSVRELVRRGSPSLRGDAALNRSPAVWGSPVVVSDAVLADEEELLQQASDVFRALRAWVMQISGLGAAWAPHDGGSTVPPAPLPEHLVALMPPRPAPLPSPHITFVLAVYVERCLTTLGARLLRLLVEVVSRSATPDVIAQVADVETAVMGDALVWSWLQGMRVRTYIAQEAAHESVHNSRSSPSFSPGGELSRKPGPGTAAVPPPSTLVAGVDSPRKSSVPSVVTGPGSSPRRPSSGAGASGSAVQRKGSSSSTGLGISATALSAPPPPLPANDDAFDQLLQSGRTLKLSSTPDRLRTVETRSNGSPASSPSRGIGRKLLARDPQPRGLFAEEDEVTDDASLIQAERGKRESFMDLLNSPPPGSSSTSHRLSLVPRRPVPADDPSHPMSVAMRVQDSQDSTQTLDSAVSDTAPVADSPRTRAYKAKDERRDLASERQINRDLANFFAGPPPQAAAPRSDRLSAAFADAPATRPPAPQGKSKSGFRGLMSKVTGGSSSSSSSSSKKDPGPRVPALDPPSSPPPPSYRSRSSLSAQSSNQGPPSMPMRAGGFGESVVAATYAAPPGLSSPGKGRESSDRMPSTTTTAAAAGGAGQARPSRRTKSLGPSAPGHPAEADIQGTPRHPSDPLSPDGRAAAAPAAKGIPASFEGGNTGPNHVTLSSVLHPPIPPVPGEAAADYGGGLGPPVSITPPRRSSSLKRNGRERERSAANSTATSMESRPREDSATSTSSSRGPSPALAPASHRLVEVESSAPPVVVVPSAPASAHSSESEQLAAESTRTLSVQDDRLVGSDQAAWGQGRPRLIPEGDVVGLDALPNGHARPAPLSPVEEVPTPASSQFVPSAAPPELPNSSTPLSTPPLAVFSSPPGGALPGQLTTGTLVGTKSIVALLRDLRAAMLFAQTKEDCVDLVEGMLRDQAKRVEALAGREREPARMQSPRTPEEPPVAGGPDHDSQSDRDAGAVGQASPSAPGSDIRLRQEESTTAVPASGVA